MREASLMMRRRITVFSAILLGLFLLSSPFAMLWNTQAAGTISGRVFQDFNANGVYDTSGGTAANPTATDVGIQNVTVTAYDSSGAARGTTTSGTGGIYNLSATGTGPYRIEFTNLPAGFAPSARNTDSVGAGTATNSGSTVQFVNDGTTADVNLAVNRPEEYCQNNPNLLTCRFAEGAANGIYGSNRVLVDFPFWAGTIYSDATEANYDNPTAHSLTITASQIGTTFSLAYARSTRRIYASSFFKRHAGFGPGADGTINNADDPGAIYVVNPLNNSIVNTFTVPGATTNSHDTGNYGDDNLDIAWNAVGKTSLGGMDLASDESRLFVMNLENRTLYALNPATGAVLASQAVPTAGVPTPGGTATNCAAADVRPFAVKYFRNNVYVGMVCSAESTQNATNLRAYIYQVNPTTLAFGASPLFSFALNYTRGVADPGWSANWRPWFATISTDFAYPQPMLTDIAFDNDNLVVGLRDRVGDQALDNGPNAKRTAGDTIRACGAFGAWTLESNGRCGGTGSAPQGTGQGIGNGEFYHQDDFSNPANSGNFHDEVSWGTLGNVPGTNRVLTSLLDPISRTIASGATFDGGFRWLNGTTGNADRAYRVYNGTGATDVPDFGKANGLGDVTEMCNLAPIEVGNRVWNDANGNGIQDPGETAIQNVNLQLWADTDNNGTVDTQVGAATTNGNGNYFFGGVGNTNMSTFACQIPGSSDSRIAASADDAEQNAGTGAVSITDGDLELTADGATLQQVGVRFPALAIPQGATITNAYIEFTPRTDGQAVNSGNPTITIRAQNADTAAAFAATNNDISGRAVTGASVSWSPANWTSPVAAQTPNLTTLVQAVVNRGGWASGNAMAFIMSGAAANTFRRAWAFDGNAGFAPRLVVQYTAASTCTYTINPNTKYEVRIPATNFNTGQALNNLAPTAPDRDATTNGDSRDSDGVVVSGNQVMAMFTTGGAGQNNHTFDFGFKAAATTYSLGNRLWLDTNNDGRIQAAEVGVANVSVSVFADANSDGQPDNPATPLGTTTTDTTGYYRFDNLAAGTYVVRVNPPGFANGATLAGYQNTSGNTTGDVDSDTTNAGENGINPTGAANSVQTGGILSNTITLGPGAAEPLNEADVQATGQGSLDGQSDLTVDFGFYRACVSGTMWNDTGAGANNNNGILDAGETTIPSVRVLLYNSAGVEILVGPDGILGTSDDAVNGVVTNGSGNYSFCGLPPGQYRVVVIPNGATSSTPSSTNPDDNVDNNDDGTPGSGTFTGRIVSGLVTVTPGNTGALGNTVVTNSTGSTVNPTLDFGFVLPPTAVDLASFEAFADLNGGVTLKWVTGGEADNLGFNIYRERDGKRELVNKALIAGSALRSSVNSLATGDNYSWFDEKGTPDAVYYLEDIDLNGVTNLRGAFSPVVQFSGVRSESNSKLLNEIGDENQSSPQTDAAADAAKDEQPKNAAVQANVATQNGVKISVKRDGWYRVTAAQLQAAGFDLNTNRNNWKLFTGGVEIPLKLTADGSVEFFGSGLDLPHTDTQVYYLVNGVSAGQRLTLTKNSKRGGLSQAVSFQNTARIQSRTMYASGILNGDAENWFGEVVMSGSPTAQNITVFNPDAAGQARLSVKLQGLTFVNHVVSIRFNDLDLGTVNYELQANQQFDFDVPMSAVRTGANQITLQAVGGSSDISAVDSISLTYLRQYKAENNRLRFTVPSGQSVRLSQITANDADIYEIRNGRVASQLDAEPAKDGGDLYFTINSANYNREFIVVGENQAEPVVSVVADETSNWRNTANRADFVIIASKSLQAPAERLATFRSGQGLLTKVVLVEDLYDEFNFGVQSPEALKRFFQAAALWQTKPQFALLFGDSTYDSRGYLATVNRNLVPTKLIDTFTMETASDAWLADLNNDGVEDIGLGRIPVITQTDADRVVDKLIRYDQAGSTNTKSNLFVSDTGFETGINNLRAQLPNSVSATTIHRASLTDANMRSQLLQRLNDSATVVTYSGHGTPTFWTNGSVLRADDAPVLANQKLPFYLLMTCLNGYTHGENGDSLAEALLKSNNGAVAVWTSTAVTFYEGQVPVSENVTNQLFRQNPSRLGTILRAGKLSTPDMDIRRTWLLVGDPTITIR